MKAHTAPRDKTSRFCHEKSLLAAAVSAASLFNAHGVVDNPVFVMARPVGTKCEITITVRAHCIGKNQWIAAATWGSLTGHLPFDGTYQLYSPKGLGATLTASGGGRATCTGVYLIGGKARGLTPREASRMQGMPEWAAHHPVKGHALKHAGNAVAVPVARELGRQLAGILTCRS